MIKAKDLRMGNWLFDSEEGHKDHFKVTSADIMCISLNGPETYKPIVLSKNIFERAGFERIGVGLYRKTYKNISLLGSCFDRKPISIEIENLVQNLDVFYLHQLQNLYYVLTCTELEIDLKGDSSTDVSVGKKLKETTDE